MTTSSVDDKSSHDSGRLHLRDLDRAGFPALFAVIWRARFLLIGVAVVAAVLGAVLEFTRTPVYEGETTFLPGSALEGEVAASGQGFRAVAQQFGLGSLPSNDPTAILEAILYSRAFLLRVLDSTIEVASNDVRADSLVLGRVVESPRDREAALRGLKRALRFRSASASGLITISVQLTEREAVAPFLNRLVADLDRFHRTLVGKRAAEELAFIEGRLGEARASLDDAEDAFGDFLDRNQRFADSPQLLLQKGRLEREVAVHQTAYLTLRNQYELARINQVREVPVVSVVDRAWEPQTPSGPGLVLMVVVAGLGGFVVAGLFVFSSDLVRHPPRPEPVE